jgi:hypothetical protein
MIVTAVVEITAMAGMVMVSAVVMFVGEVRTLCINFAINCGGVGWKCYYTSNFKE